MSLEMTATTAVFEGTFFYTVCFFRFLEETTSQTKKLWLLRTHNIIENVISVNYLIFSSTPLAPRFQYIMTYVLCSNLSYSWRAMLPFITLLSKCIVLDHVLQTIAPFGPLLYTYF